MKREGSFAKVKQAMERKRTAESDPRDLIYRYPKGLKPNQLEPYKVLHMKLTPYMYMYTMQSCQAFFELENTVNK